jgi:hypothetical protein
MKPETPLKRRIREAYKQTRQYHDLMRIAFPDQSAHRGATQGGPPACAMPFGRAIREMGGSTAGMGSNRTVWIPALKQSAAEPRDEEERRAFIDEEEHFKR